MVLGAIDRGREAELRRLLASMNDAPGQVDAGNALIPFRDFENLHFARLLIIEDTTREDIEAYGLPPRSYPTYLAFLGDVDGDGDEFLEDAARRASKGLREIFACCEGFIESTDLVAWMKAHRTPSAADYVNWRGRTVLGNAMPRVV